MPQIRLKDVAKAYRPKDRDFRQGYAIHSVDLSIEAGEFVFVTGSSGAGKSTLLKLIAGRQTPSRGSVYLNGINISRLPRFLREHRCRGMGYMPQTTELCHKKTVGENLMDAARRGRDGQSPSVRANKALTLVGLERELSRRYPAQLNQSETRRVDLAMAILNNPKILVLDEPTANLSDDDAWDIFLLLSELNRHGVTIVMASSARTHINLLRRRVITLVDGAILGDLQNGRYGNII